MEQTTEQTRYYLVETRYRHGRVESSRLYDLGPRRERPLDTDTYGAYVRLVRRYFTDRGDAENARLKSIDPNHGTR